MYSEVFQLHADLLKALAHPRRLEIIHLLRDQELPVGDIHTMLDLPQANISQHLMVLRESGVVCCRRDGKQMYYSLCSPKIIQASDLLREVLVSQHKELHTADKMLHNMKKMVPLVHDPVCRMRLLPQTAGFHKTYLGKSYYFCASGCLKKFTDQPEVYAGSYAA